MQKIAIFASGNGSNAQHIIEYFTGSDKVDPALVLCNKPDAFVLTRAEKLGIPTILFNREEFFDSDAVMVTLAQHRIEYLILAGFLWLIPKNLIKLYAGKIINIHPALLPRHGGKGMYGMKVHEAVIAAGELESGITIHFVNECYDEGEIIFQARCPVLPSDTPERLAEKIHSLEYRWYPEVIESIVLGNPLPGSRSL